jgi:hypothetical protein
MDTVPIGHISLTSYQEAVSSLPNVGGIIADARATPTEEGHNGTDEILAMCRLMQDRRVYEWEEAIVAREQQYQSDYYISFGTIVVLGSRLCLPKAIVDELLPVVAQLMGLSEEDTNFLLQQFDPALQQGLVEAGVKVREEDKVVLARRSAGMLLKMLYAFVWQEQTFKGAWLTSPEANQIGGAIIQEINLIGDYLTGYWHPLYVRSSIGVYAGNALCKSLVAHAKWHEQSANALVDLIFVADDMHNLVLNRPLNTSMVGRPSHRSSRPPAQLPPCRISVFANLLISGEPQETRGASKRAAFVRAAKRGCFAPFLDGRFTAMLQEVEGAVRCMEAGGLHYNEATNTDTRLSCLARWAFGEPRDTMDSCLLHNNCLALANPASPSLELSFDRVKECALKTCAAHLSYGRRPGLGGCVASCTPVSSSATQQPEFMCAARCLAQHTKFSALGAAIVHCTAGAQLWSGGNATFAAAMATTSCIAGRLAPLSEFWSTVGGAMKCMKAEEGGS